ncbi:MAG: thioredoxin-dependent thiol peroxidase [Microcystis sp.]|jgi:peroxiredoxin Q/BCP|uniref:thioredoxin-dependent peroxiredoxin n=1 Tax=Microcystis aeruginosa Ma_OC_H_19870700_S124 TaxID=2486262 RepID=A0A552A9P2_MICAE|nr:MULTISPECIES: thioredoxin-dependent thiol peroxidase [unclassified Microcystis]MCZ8039387.1 thioredoxin-dependent thiol peroxidase [Microcystis sp. LE17-20A]MCZ8210666.1 thioredoxin-dependent thiol peroxidase [Microcystis sp. LE19-8.1F]TRT82164.1 MAG: thioredoxin-dependent thiol peroxidase [Microcystis aeruginosa Ma_OC_H_19870700_S124]
MTLEVGQKAPEFATPNQRGEISKLADFAGQWLVLYFYPKDNTPGCSTEAINFTALSPQFQQLNAVILGVSPDSAKSHCRFIEKHNLTIQLLSDTEHQLAEIYQVWGLKKFMGKEYMGIKRSTFLIDPQGNIAYIWSNVKVKAHAEAVLKKLEELQ